MPKLLIMGGGLDANIQWVAKAAATMNVDHETICINPQPEPRFEWCLNNDPALLNGKPMRFTGAFMRYDVFSGLYSKSQYASENAANWFAVFHAWCELNNIRILNRNISTVSGSKIAMMELARRHGFAIPRTCISNFLTQIQSMGEPDHHIAKPVSGGTYCLSLDEAIDEACWKDDLGASPAIIQQKLIYPEFRVYRIGARFFAFNINSKTLDSRLDRENEIVPIDIDTFPDDIIGSLASLTDEIRCDFCAIDLKTDPDTERLVFLELNNGPMFMGYDKTLNGAMAKEMVRILAQ